MVNWLDKALGRKITEAAEPAPFSLTCHCSETIKGFRQERARRVICARCGTAHFVLSTNVYPTSDRRFFPECDPAVTESSPGLNTSNLTRKSPPSDEIESASDDEERFIDTDEIADSMMDLVEAAWSTDSDQEMYIDDGGEDYELADSDPDIDLTHSPAAPKSARQKSSASEPPSPSVHVSTKVSDDERSTRLKLPAAGDQRRQQRLRLAAVSGLILTIAVGAIVWTIHHRKLDRAEVAMREGRDIGLVALRNRDFVTAREKLGNAVAAMELLGIDEQTTAETRRLWLQAEAGFGVLDDTDVVELAIAAEAAMVNPDENDGEIDDTDWQRQFRAQFFDRWLCIQLEPVEVITADDQFGDRVVFPALPVVHLAGIDPVLTEQTEGKLWFAGPIQSCQRDPLDDSAWLVDFDSSRVIACDGTESLVRPMLSKEQQQALRLTQTKGSSPDNTQSNERQESDDE